MRYIKTYESFLKVKYKKLEYQKENKSEGKDDGLDNVLDTYTTDEYEISKIEDLVKNKVEIRYKKEGYDDDKLQGANKDQIAKGTCISFMDGVLKIKNSTSKKIITKKSTDILTKNDPLLVAKISKEVLDSYEVEHPSDLVQKIVRYKKEGYDDTKSEEEQPKMIASGKVLSVAYQDDESIDQIRIYNDKVKKELNKYHDDILPSKEKKSTELQSQVQKKIEEYKKKDTKNIENIRNILRAMTDDDTKKEMIEIVNKKDSSTEE